MSENYKEMVNSQFDSGKCSLIPGNFQGVQNTNNITPNNEATSNEMIIKMQKFGAICSSIFFTISFLLILAALISLIKTNASNIPILILSILLSILFISPLLYLSLNVKHIKLIKNESFNLLILKKINYFNCVKSTYNLNLKNAISDIIKYETVTEEDVTINEAFVITEMINNYSEIDLNTSNIKNKPIKNLYYAFSGIKEGIYTSNIWEKLVLVLNFLNIN